MQNIHDDLNGFDGRRYVVGSFGGEVEGFWKPEGDRLPGRPMARWKGSGSWTVADLRTTMIYRLDRYVEDHTSSWGQEGAIVFRPISSNGSRALWNGWRHLPARREGVRLVVSKPGRPMGSGSWTVTDLRTTISSSWVRREQSYFVRSLAMGGGRVMFRDLCSASHNYDAAPVDKSASYHRSHDAATDQSAQSRLVSVTIDFQIIIPECITRSTVVATSRQVVEPPLWNSSIRR